MKFICLLIFLITIGCSKPELSNEISNKIDLFIKNEEKYFENIGIRSLARGANQKSPLEFEVTKPQKPSHAIIQTKPEMRILKNYYSDSLTIEFVRAFAELGLTNFYNYDSGIQPILTSKPITLLEFKFDRDRIIVFRGGPYFDSVSAKALIEKSIPIRTPWRYTRIKQTEQ
jgi:hypothetical protein